MKSKLTHAEMLVMGIIWDEPKRLVLSEVVAAVNERWGKDWKPQTVSTYLAHLVRKGYLKMHRNGKIYTYEPLKGKDEYMAVMLGALYNWYSPELKETDFVLKIGKPEARMSHLEINCHEEKALFLIEASRLYDEGLRIEALVTDTNVGGKWIPCSERLPDKLGFYIAMIKGAEIPTWLIYDPKNGWYDVSFTPYRVIAWQPLPEPYKEKE